MKKTTLNLGQVLLSRNVGDLITIDQPFRKFVQTSLTRHKSSDWGNCCNEDIESNNQALQHGSRIFSSYHISKELMISESKIWIITEADRSSTTILFPSDY